MTIEICGDYYYYHYYRWSLGLTMVVKIVI